MQAHGDEPLRSDDAACGLRALQGGIRQFRTGALAFRGARAGSHAGAVFDECRLEKVAFSRCDLTQGEFRGTRLRGLSFADSDIRGMRVGEVGSFELKGLKINALQAVDLVRLLGVEVEE